MWKSIYFIAICTFLVVLFPKNLIGQGYATKPYQAVEVFAGVGSTHYFGDLGGRSGTVRGMWGVIDNLGIDIEQSRYGGTIGLRYIVNKTFAYSVHLAPMLIAGSDANSIHAARGKYFYSYMTEGGLSAEMFIANRLTGAAPYFTVGFGGLAYNSKASWLETGKWSGVQYSSDAIFGFGVRLPFNRRFTQNIELGFRYVFTDDLDRFGDSRVGDTFYMLTYKLNMDLDKVFVYDYRGRINR